MALPRLNLPTTNINQRPRPYLKVRQLERWLSELPQGNTTVLAHQVLEQLRQINRSRYPARERISLNNALRPVFHDLLQAIRQPLRQTSLPLDKNHYYRAILLQNLLEEMAVGYKFVVSELAMSEELKEYDQLILSEAIYMAMVYLTHRLVDIYSIYAPEPEYIWSDLNQLYQYAEFNHLHLNRVDDPLPDTPLPVHLTIDFAYKRVILLALTEPYHLMQYEAEDLYRIIASSVHGCMIESYHGVVANGEFAIDLNADAGPRFVQADEHWQPVDPRTVDIGMAKNQLNVHLQRLLRANANNAEFEVTTLIERQQRDMLLRLADAWHAVLTRKTKRFNLSAELELTSGLNAAHYFISGQTTFSPEVGELKLVSGVDDDSAGMTEDFGTSFKLAARKDRRHEQPVYRLDPWQQSNISPIGIGLHCRQEQNTIEVKVGELVVFRDAGKKPQHWHVGVIRWMKHDLNEDSAGLINIGIKNLAVGAIAVGTKATRGLGVGTEYFRSIMIPKNVSNHQYRSILVPALVYDIGTELTVNMGEKLIHVRLTRMLRSTRSFTQFDFDIIEQPLHYIL